jgi:hypothetical protein
MSPEGRQRPSGPFHIHGDPMTLASGVRILTLLVAAGVAAAGVLIAAGVLTRAGMTPEVRISVGVVAVLYGVYKFVNIWFRRTGGEES